MSSILSTIGHTPQHTPLLIVKLHLAGEEIEVVVDTEASSCIVGKCLAYKLEIWKRARKVKVRQRDGSHLGGNFVVNITFKAIDSSLVLSMFTMDAEVLDIGNRDVILELSQLLENGSLVDTQDRCLRNVNRGQVISGSISWIPVIIIIEEEPLENGGVLLIIDISERFSCQVSCFSAEDAVKNLQHKSWDQHIPL